LEFELHFFAVLCVFFCELCGSAPVLPHRPQRIREGPQGNPRDAEIAQASREFIGDQDVTENTMREQAVDTMQVRRITLPDGRYLIFYTFDRESPDRVAQKIETSEHSEDKPPSQPERG
jgi:hypothetical protein